MKPRILAIFLVLLTVSLAVGTSGIRNSEAYCLAPDCSVPPASLVFNVTTNIGIGMQISSFTSGTFWGGAQGTTQTIYSDTIDCTPGNTYKSTVSWNTNLAGLSSWSLSGGGSLSTSGSTAYVYQTCPSSGSTVSSTLSGTGYILPNSVDFNVPISSCIGIGDSPIMFLEASNTEKDMIYTLAWAAPETYTYCDGTSEHSMTFDWASVQIYDYSTGDTLLLNNYIESGTPAFSLTPVPSGWQYGVDPSGDWHNPYLTASNGQQTYMYDCNSPGCQYPYYLTSGTQVGVTLTVCYLETSLVGTGVICDGYSYGVEFYNSQSFTYSFG